MAVSLGPIASGLPKNIVQKLLETEKRPLKQLQVRKGKESDRLKLVDDLSGKVGSVRSDINQLSRYRQFLELKAVVGRPEVMDVSVDKNVAEPGTYQVEVTQLAGRSSMLSTAFENPDEADIGVGYFSYELPDGTEKEIFIDDEHSSLNGIAKLINQNKDLNLHALVVDDGTNDGSDDTPTWRLIVSHKESGEINDAEFPTFYFVGGDEDFDLEEERIAQNSLIKVNGFPVEFEGNTVTSLLPGVTIDLKEAMPGKEFTLAITEDRVSIKGKIMALIDKLNEVLSFVQQQNTLDADSDTTNTLGGDITLSTLENQIRNIVTMPVRTETGIKRLSNLGIQFKRDGLINVNEEKLEKSLEADFDTVVQLFTGINDSGEGFMGSLKESINGYVRINGILTTRKQGIKRRIKNIDSQIDSALRRLENREKFLREKFARLEGNLAKLKGQQSQVQSTLGGSSLLDQLNLNTAP